MKKLLIIFLFLPFIGLAQPYGNEWINFDQDYYKIMVPENGIYRITYDDLEAAGFPVSAVDPKLLQIFRRGDEIAIHFEGDTDPTFDPTEYIEFYGQKNDGKLDEELYVSPDAQPHQYSSLYSDSSAYFLTVSSVEGKRMANTTPFTGVTPDNYVFHDAISLNDDQYSVGVVVGESTSLTQFDYGEGFTGFFATERGNIPNRDIIISGIDAQDITGPNPQLELLVVGRNFENHDYEVLVGPDVSNLTSIGIYNFTGFTNHKVNSAIDWSQISPSGELVVRISVIDDGGNPSRISITYGKLKYARLTDAENQPNLVVDTEIKLSGGNALNYVNVPSDAKIYDISDPTNVIIGSDNDLDPTIINIGFLDATSTRRLAIGQHKTNFSINKAGLRPIDPRNHNYLIISHPTLMKGAGEYTDVIEAYAEYRASWEGGSFDTLVVDINMLYNQFSFGQPTPVAIYRFMRYMVASGNPEHLFLIGKALDVSLKYHKASNWINSKSDLVPTAGSPGSDLVYTAGLGTDPNAIHIPVGRLSVMFPQQVANYLDKVKEIESTPYDALWRKNLLHLSGGNSLDELELFKNYVDGLAEIAKGPFLGGEETTISKKTTGSVEFINVADEVNAGLNIITFFGHSAPNVIDVDIGDVSDLQHGYDNKGKYPLILMNGCSTGNIYEIAFIFGEDWIATADKGATGVIAHSSYGYPFILRIWSQSFYSLAYADSVYMEKSVGQLMTKAGEEVLGYFGPDPNYVVLTQVQQMGLQGDPAVKVFGTYTPDYEVSDNNIELIPFAGKEVVAEADSFAIAFAVRNFGAYREDSLEVFLSRRLPNGEVIGDTITYPPSRYLDTLTYVFDNQGIDAAGQNVFEITLDPLNKLIEHDDFLNNHALYEKTIYTSGTSNVLPYNFRNQSEKSIDLAFQPGDVLMKNRTYQVEIDTSSLFNSALRKDTVIQGSKLIKWNNLSLQGKDSAVYYWRTKYEFAETTESDEWAQSSFSVIEGASDGWAQLEHDQLKLNSLQGLVANDSRKSLDFEESALDVEIITHGANKESVVAWDTKLRVNGLNYIYFKDNFSRYTYCPLGRLNLVAFNKENAAPYAPIPGNQSSKEPWTCGRSPQIINSYSAGKSLDEIIDALGEGDNVILFTTGSFNFNSLSPQTLAKLENLGADATVLGNKTPAEPYILVGRKGLGSGNAVVELIADPADALPTDEQTISYTGNITGIYSKGTIIVDQIGPANEWKSLYLNVTANDPTDNFSLDLYGSTLEGNSTLLQSNITTEITDLSSIIPDPDTYPYLTLELEVEDTVNLTAPQLDKWIIDFEPRAEGFLSFDSLNDTTEPEIVLKEGEDLIVKLSFENISQVAYNIDSLEVRYTSFNKNTRTPDGEHVFMIAAPAPGIDSAIHISIDTRGKVGSNDLTVFVNPMIEPEQSFGNNRINMRNYLTVIKDETNPVLDVSFDGEYIFDGDIVAPNPVINILVRDENPHLLKEDTVGIDVFLKRPCEGCTMERISLSSSDIDWTAQDSKNPFTIDFSPKNLEDGIYELQVQVEDATGNVSGVEPYKISFEVINESTVTNFYPYPNPFSTSVKFIFTLTGNEVPDEVMIRIMTVSGRVVKEIMQDELGPLKIGNNVTDYAWNGKDEYGDQLANGVYLYKVFLRKNGQNVELRPSGGDRGFKNGYGKLYLLR